MLAVAATGWGCSTTLSAYSLRQFTPTDLLAIELLSGGTVIWAVALRSAREQFVTSDWKAFAVLGLCEPGLTYLLGNEGLQRDSASTAALLFAMETVLIVPLAALLLSERVSRKILSAIGIGSIGALVTAWGSRSGGDTLLGHVLILAATLAAALYALLARRSAHRSSALVVTTYQLLAASAIAVPYTLIAHATAHHGFPNADLAHWVGAFATGLSGVALPFLLYNRAIAKVRATIAAGILNIVPLVGFATAVAFLGDKATLAKAVGGLLILSSAAWLGRSEMQVELAESRVDAAKMPGC
jgi:drug/metabolite transporter (DMT)-like permease